MKTELIVLLIAVGVIALAMTILRGVLYYVVVVPNLPGRGTRPSLATIFWFTYRRDINGYIASLTSESRYKWQNWYIAYSGYLIALIFVAWALLLALVR